MLRRTKEKHQVTPDKWKTLFRTLRIRKRVVKPLERRNRFTREWEAGRKLQEENGILKKSEGKYTGS